MRTVNDIDYKGNGNPMQLLDMYLPEKDGFDTLIFFHGGGLEHGNRKSGKRFSGLTKKGIAVVSAEYRMYPETEFPHFIEDAADCVAYILKNIKNYGGNGRIFVTGASAGAYITMMLCLDKKYLSKSGVDYRKISGFISESAQQFAHFNILKHRGFDKRIERIDETAPIGYVKDGLDIAPLLIIYYTDDMVCRPEENRLMYRSMKRFLPEDAVLQIAEIEGKHCEPADMNTLTDCITKFIKSVKLNKKIKK